MSDAFRDSKKDAAEGAAAIGGAILLSGGGVAAALLGAATSQVVNAVRGHRERRQQKWISQVLRVEPDEATRRIREGIAENRDEVVAAILGAAHAAEATTDDAALACVAQLTRMYVRGEAARWLFRAGLELFKSLDAAEIDDLRDLMTNVVELELPTVRLRATPFVRGARSSLERQEVNEDERSGFLRSVLGPSPTIGSAVQLFLSLKLVGLSADAPAGRVGSGAARNVILVQHEVAQVLLAAVSAVD